MIHKWIWIWMYPICDFIPPMGRINGSGAFLMTLDESPKIDYDFRCTMYYVLRTCTMHYALRTCTICTMYLYYVLGTNRVAIRVLGAFIPGNCMKIRPESNGNSPGTPKSKNKIKLKILVNVDPFITSMGGRITS